MKVRRYLRQFRRNLEAGDQVTLVTDNGIKTVQIVSIFGNKFSYFDSDLNQQIDRIKNVLPDHKIV